MLSRAERAVLDTALQKYRPGRTDLIPVGGIAQLKPALRLMMALPAGDSGCQGCRSHSPVTPGGWNACR